MAYEINITGEIIPFNFYEMDGYVNCEYVDKQLELANGDDVKINMNSYGGDVDEGFMIYTSLRKYAKEHGAKVTTYAKGRCCSIATVIFLAGDTRIVNKYLEPFVHNAWTYGEGDSKEFQKISADLESVNDKIGRFYAEHTDLTYKEARALMDGETSISPQECINIRFATEIENVMRPAALKKILNKKTILDMSNIKDEKGLIKALAGFFAGKGAKNLDVFTSTNETLNFPDLGDDETPKKGDKATLDGEAANGEVTLQDGTVYVFVDGVLDEIREKEEEVEEETETIIADLQKENQNLKDQIAAQASKISSIENKVSAFEKEYSALGKLVSNHVIDDKGNGGKTNPKKDDKKGLAGWANKK